MPRTYLRIRALALGVTVVAAGCATAGPTGAGPDVGAPSVSARPAAPALAAATIRTRPADAAELAAGAWQALPVAPIPPRQGASVLWTGREMLVWGGASGRDGTRLHGDGAAWDPGRGSWRLLPPAPLAARTGQSAAWTGGEMVVWGGDTAVSDRSATPSATGAAYDPRTRRWSALPAAPLSPRAGALAVVTGGRVLILGGTGAPGAADAAPALADGAVFDPADARWRAVAGPTATGGHPIDWVAAVATTAGVLAWSAWTSTSRGAGGTPVSTSGGNDVYSWDLATGRWTRLAPGAGAIPAVDDVIAAGAGVVVRGLPYNCGDCPGPFVPEVSAVYHPASGTWTALPADPLGGENLLSAWTGAALFSFDPQGAYGPVGPGSATVYDPADRRWTRLATAPFVCQAGTDPVWTGRQVLLYCPRTGPGTAGSHDGLALDAAAA